MKRERFNTHELKQIKKSLLHDICKREYLKYKKIKSITCKRFWKANRRLFNSELKGIVKI